MLLMDIAKHLFRLPCVPTVILLELCFRYNSRRVLLLDCTPLSYRRALPSAHLKYLASVLNVEFRPRSEGKVITRQN